MLANMMMTLAAWLTPKAQTEWQSAMQGEYAALTHGGTGWALGCLATAAGWRLRADGAWLAVLVLAPWVYFELISWWLWNLEIWMTGNGLALPNLGAADFYIKALLPYLAYAVGMGWWRVNRVGLSATLMLAVCLICAYVRMAMFVPDDPLGYISIMNLWPVVGEAMFWGVLACGAVLGGRLRTLTTSYR